MAAFFFFFKQAKVNSMTSPLFVCLCTGFMPLTMGSSLSGIVLGKIFNIYTVMTQFSILD